MADVIVEQLEKAAERLTTLSDRTDLTGPAALHTVAAAVRIFTRLLAPDGGMLFTNIAQGNPYRCWIEYMGEWMLIERDEADVQSLLETARIGHVHVPVRITRDATGLALLVELGALAGLDTSDGTLLSDEHAARPTG